MEWTAHQQCTGINVTDSSGYWKLSKYDVEPRHYSASYNYCASYIVRTKSGCKCTLKETVGRMLRCRACLSWPIDAVRISFLYCTCTSLTPWFSSFMFFIQVATFLTFLLTATSLLTCSCRLQTTTTRGGCSYNYIHEWPWVTGLVTRNSHHTNFGVLVHSYDGLLIVVGLALVLSVRFKFILVAIGSLYSGPVHVVHHLINWITGRDSSAEVFSKSHNENHMAMSYVTRMSRDKYTSALDAKGKNKKNYDTGVVKLRDDEVGLKGWEGERVSGWERITFMIPILWLGGACVCLRLNWTET